MMNLVCRPINKMNMLRISIFFQKMIQNTMVKFDISAYHEKIGMVRNETNLGKVRPNLCQRESEKNTGKYQFIDDSRVIPYNPFLLLKYGCHINIEYVFGQKACKYIFKYLLKGIP